MTNDEVHPPPAAFTSRMEMTGGITDSATAHSRARDPDYKVALPETCATCYAQALVQAEIAAQTAIREVRTDGQPQA